MPEPIVFISHNKVKAGKLAEFQRLFREGAELIEAGKPGTVAYLAYTNEEGTILTIIHVFPDSTMMAQHMQGAGDRAKQAYEFIEPDTLEVFGNPGDQILQAMRQAAGAGIHLIVHPQPLGGYLRLTTA